MLRTVTTVSLIFFMWMAWQSGKCSDFTFKVGSETFQAHKSILAMRSPVLCGMMEAGGIEATTGEIMVEDIDPVAFKQANSLSLVLHMQMAHVSHCVSPSSGAALHLHRRGRGRGDGGDG